MDNQKIIENIKIICSDEVKPNKEWLEDTTKPSKLFYNEKALVRIDERSLNAFNEMVKEYMADDFVSKNFSAKYIETKLGRLLIKILGKEENLRLKTLHEDLDNFWDELKKDIKEYTLIFPITNLEISKPFSIGNIHFFNFLDERKNIQEHFFKVLDSAKTKKELIDKIKDTYTKKFDSLSNFACAMVNVKGESDRCIVVGREKVESALDVLRIYVPLNVYSRKSYTGILGSIAATDKICLCYNNNFISENHENSGFLFPFNINENYLQIMDNNGLNNLTKIIDNPTNDFDNSLLTAIHWFGKSIKNVEEKDRFIYFCIALETLLIKDKSEPIVNCLSERIAFLLENDKVKRKALSSLVKYLYDLRSKIVHRGLKDILTNDIFQLHLITQQLILKLIKDSNFSSRETFFEYLEDLKFDK